MFGGVTFINGLIFVEVGSSYLSANLKPKYSISFSAKTHLAGFNFNLANENRDKNSLIVDGP